MRAGADERHRIEHAAALPHRGMVQNSHVVGLFLEQGFQLPAKGGVEAYCDRKRQPRGSQDTGQSRPVGHLADNLNTGISSGLWSEKM
jgi:hypothetical protein